MLNEDARDPEEPVIRETADSPEEMSAAERHRLAAEDEGDEESGYGCGV